MVENYTRYKKLQASDISWLGSIPANWSVKRFKNLFRIRKRIAGTLGFKILSITQKGIKVKDTTSGDGQLSMDYSKYQLVYPDDFAMNHMDLLTGFVDISKHEGVTSPDYRVFTLEDKNSDRRYFLYLLQLCYIAKIFYPLGQGAAQVGRWRLPTEAFNNFIGPVPPLPEQIQIAKFLDHETAKIDLLIRKQQELIALLKEKRQAVISHAVTKGLNPDAPMKDSGVEWLGEVPEHWKIAKLGYRYHVQLGKMLDDKKITGKYLAPYLRNTDVQWDQINKSDLPEMDFRKEEMERFSVRKGDLLVCEGGEVGRCAIWDLETPCFYQKALHRLRPLRSSSDDTRFMFFVLFEAVHQERFTGGTDKATIAHLPAESFKQYRFTYPPLKEQREIAHFLDAQKDKFETLIEKSETQIYLLQERRTALISAAVTGKIDVRDLKAPD